MSNDRLFVRCKFCGQETLVAKLYIGGSEVWPGNAEPFIDKHMRCNPGVTSWGGEPGLEFSTESHAREPGP